MSDQRVDLRRLIVWGAMWGFAVSLVEALALFPAEAWRSKELLLWWMFYWIVPWWCAVGCAFIWWVERSARITLAHSLVAGYVLIALLASAVQPPLSTALSRMTSRLLPSLQSFSRDLGIGTPDWLDLTLYNFWFCLFYGGLLIVAYRMAMRSERARTLLHESAMERSRTEGILDVERLQALQAQIEPTMLLETLGELQQRYREAPEAAERLLENLVEFLRCATRGLSHPVSTIQTEIVLALAFAELQRERGKEHCWRIVEQSPETRSSQRFPSLLILPLLALGGERGMLRLSVDGERTTLSLLGLARRLPTDLAQQIRVRLQALYAGQFLLESASSEAAASNYVNITLIGQ
jgi:hypothetical protein